MLKRNSKILDFVVVDTIEGLDEEKALSEYPIGKHFIDLHAIVERKNSEAGQEVLVRYKTNGSSRMCLSLEKFSVVFGNHCTKNGIYDEPRLVVVAEREMAEQVVETFSRLEYKINTYGIPILSFSPKS